MPDSRSIKNQSLTFSLTLPGSRSMTHRALILAALAEGVSEISDLNLSHKIITLIHTMQQLGIVIQVDTDTQSCIVAGTGGYAPKKQANIWCQNLLGLNYILALCALTPGIFYINGPSHLKQAIYKEYFQFLRQQGVQFIPTDAILPVTIVGKHQLKGGEIFLNQAQKMIASILLMISPYFARELKLSVANAATTAQLEMTTSMMAEFGVLSQHFIAQQYLVPNLQRYQARDYQIEPDASLAAYFFAAAALTQSVITIGVTPRSKSKQRAIKLLTLLEKIGCTIEERAKWITLQGPETFSGIETTVTDIDDVFFALVAMAPYATTPSTLKVENNVSVNDAKNLSALKKVLMQLNINTEFTANSLKIYPGKPMGKNIDIHNNPHLGMMVSMMALKTNQLSIKHNECILHYYPDFFTNLNKFKQYLYEFAY